MRDVPAGTKYCIECGGVLAESRALVIVAAPGVWQLTTPVRMRCDDCGKTFDVVGGVNRHVGTLRPHAAA